jgi:hypothetical protein
MAPRERRGGNISKSFHVSRKDGTPLSFGFQRIILSQDDFK